MKTKTPGWLRRHIQNIRAAINRYTENKQRQNNGIGRADMRPATRRDGPHKHPNPWPFRVGVWRARYDIPASPTKDRRPRSLA